MSKLMRFIRWGLGNARRKRCGWELVGFDEWEGFNIGRRWKRIYRCVVSVIPIKKQYFKSNVVLFF